MSLASSMQTVELWEKSQAKDEWGAPTEEETFLYTVDCAINTIQGTNIAKDVNYTEITHLGLTYTTGLKKGQLLKTDSKTYVIDKPPIEITRFTQLYLKEIV